jgi:hypothetical protein
VDVSTGAAVADDDAVSTVVPPSSTKDKGAYVGVSVTFEGVCVGGRRCFVDCCLPPLQTTLYLLPPPPGRHCCRLPSSPAQAENGCSRHHGQVRVTREACCLERFIERLNISILVDIYLTDSLIYSNIVCVSAHLRPAWQQNRSSAYLCVPVSSLKKSQSKAVVSLDG